MKEASASTDCSAECWQYFSNNQTFPDFQNIHEIHAVDGVMLRNVHDWMLFQHFPNSLQLYKGLAEINCGRQVWRLTKWMIGMFGIHSTGLTCPWLGIGLSALYWGHHCLMFPSCPLIICWKANSDNLIYGNIMKSITIQDRWQLLLCLQAL